ncbi:MAG: hypothetical protein KA534_00080 [Sediminibacterium sp.]|nr:hypothetical protein [Sediminibacterium sp.]MBP6144147.1 hypothetical protein [Sediminibacterium sp.]
MTTTHLTRKLKSSPQAEILTIRLHRALSWLKSAEKQEGNLDIKFLSLWIAFNACYAVDINGMSSKPEKAKLRDFTSSLVQFDRTRLYNLFWDKYSGPVRVIIENKFVFEKFWEYNRGEVEDYIPAFNKSIATALNCLSKENIEGLMEIVLERLYTLRNSIIHGGSTFNSKLNRAQLKDACNIMQLLVPIIIDIMLENSQHDWGEIAYPVVK